MFDCPVRLVVVLSTAVDETALHSFFVKTGQQHLNVLDSIVKASLYCTL